MKKLILFFLMMCSTSLHGQIIGNYTANRIVGGRKPAKCNAGPPADVWVDTAIPSTPVLNLCAPSGWIIVGGAGGGNLSGTLTATRVPFASGVNTLTDAAGFTFASSVLTVPNVLDSGLSGVGTRCVHADSSGNLGVAAADCGSGGGGSPAGMDTQIQFNNMGSFGADPGLTFSAGSLSNIQSVTSSVDAIIYGEGHLTGGAGNNDLYGLDVEVFGSNIDSNDDGIFGGNIVASLGATLTGTLSGLKVSTSSTSATVPTQNTLELATQIISSTVATATALLIDDVSGGSTNRAIKTGAGDIVFGTLTTTGSAGGKNVVCVDVATGKLYASSATNNCAN